MKLFFESALDVLRFLGAAALFVAGIAGIIAILYVLVMWSSWVFPNSSVVIQIAVGLGSVVIILCLVAGIVSVIKGKNVMRL